MTHNISSSDRLNGQSKISANSEAVAQSTEQLSVDRFNIVHASTGRVRVRISERNFYSLLETISQYLRQQQGVREVISNQQTGSLLITFDENQLSLQQILDTLEKFGIASPESASKTDIFAEWKSLDFWREQSISFIPLFTGLAVTGGLGISGLVGIPVYMITADATRWIIDYLQSEIFGSESDKDSENAATTSLSQSSGAIADKLSNFPDNQKLNTSNFNPINLVNEKPANPGKITYSILHEIPGRIRFHLPLIAEDDAYAPRLEKLLKNDAQVTSVRVNYDAASIAITYDNRQTNISYWVSLMELAWLTNASINSNSADSEMTEVTDRIERKTISGGESQNISSIWADMKPTSMSYSLAFLANSSFL